MRYDSTARAPLYEDIASRFEALPGVESAGGKSKLPATGSYNAWGVEALTGPLARTTQSNIEGENRVVSGDYFRVLGIPVLEGRAFDPVRTLRRRSACS